MSRTVCLVTARMASARCPGKALQELLPGEPLLGVLLKRMRTWEWHIPDPTADAGEPGAERG